jgi:ribosomal protein S13
MGIDLDSQTEAEYLVALASALGMGAREANAIHAKLGIPALAA